MKEETKNTLKRIYFTLNDIEIHGRQNMDMLLGCIMAIDEILKSEEEE